MRKTLNIDHWCPHVYRHMHVYTCACTATYTCANTHAHTPEHTHTHLLTECGSPPVRLRQADYKCKINLVYSLRTTT